MISKNQTNADVKHILSKKIKKDSKLKNDYHGVGDLPSFLL